MKKKKKLSFHLISNLLKLSKIKKEKILHTKITYRITILNPPSLYQSKNPLSTFIFQFFFFYHPAEKSIILFFLLSLSLYFSF